MTSQKTLIYISFFIVLVTSPLVSGADLPISVKGQNFEEWLAGFRTHALAEGISPAILKEALDGLKPNQRVIQLDRNQPESRFTLNEYLNRVVTKHKISTGKKKLLKHKTLLDIIADKYGVPPRYIVALWGIETNFGRLTGGFPVVQSLATLTFDGRRQRLFQRELIFTLRAVTDFGIPLDKMRGSWAGAMGQFQFMPSTLHQFGVDYDGDGRIDIWNNLQDSFASAANYLARAGWHRGQLWGREVRVPKGLNRTVIGLGHKKLLSKWQALGVRRLNGLKLPEKPDLNAAIIQINDPASSGRAFVVYDNYRVLLRWNRSNLFALSVGTLADRIGQKQP